MLQLVQELLQLPRARSPSCACRARRAARRAAARSGSARAPARARPAGARRPRARAGCASARWAMRNRSRYRSASLPAARTRCSGGRSCAGRARSPGRRTRRAARPAADVDAACSVEPDVSPRRDLPERRLHQAGDRAQDRRLSGAGRPDEGDGAVDLERSAEVERPKRDDDLVEDELCHEQDQAGGTRAGRALTRTSTALIASGGVEVEIELRVDRERQRLRHALEAAGEHDRGAELAEPARERERQPGDEPAAREREHDAEERAGRTGAERARGGDEIRVDRLEGGDRLPDVERAGDERDGDVDGALRERERDPERVELEPSSPTRPNAASRPMPATAGGSTSGSSTSVMASERPGKRRVASRYAVGVPKSRISACAIRLVFRLTMKRVRDDRVRELVDQLARRYVCTKIATIGSSEERRARPRRRAEQERRAGFVAKTSRADALPACVGFTRGRKPAARSFAWPALLSTLLMNACASRLVAARRRRRTSRT